MLQAGVKLFPHPFTRYVDSAVGWKVLPWLFLLVGNLIGIGALDSVMSQPGLASNYGALEYARTTVKFQARNYHSIAGTRVGHVGPSSCWGRRVVRRELSRWPVLCGS